MINGYNGRILHVDLTSGKTTVEEPSAVWYRTYLGGGAMASYYLLKELPPHVDPLSEQNILVFASNVISGAPISGFSRYTVAARSPLTGAYGESEAGGWWGPELKFSGYDGIVVRGRAARPVYLWIHDGDAEIRDAAPMWGLDNGGVRERIIEELGDPHVRIASIGPAGERLVRFANVINELRHANGRTGMGAVMGSKNLKAIAVRGNKKMAFADPDRVSGIARWHNERIRSHLPNVGMHNFGTPGLITALNSSGILPTRYFKEGVFEGVEHINGQTLKDTILHGNETCFACSVSCKRAVACAEPYRVEPQFGGPEYETIAALGSLCGVDNLPAIARGHELCNRLGMDTISTGVLVAFTMECFERGILTEKDVGGRACRFGDADAMLWLVEEMGYRRGLGDVLAKGVKQAAHEIGRGAEEFAFHTKGQEVPMHDPRGKTSLALAYALSPTGADHLEAQHETAFQAAGPILEQLAPLGILEPIKPLSLDAGKVKAFVDLQRVWSMYNSLGVCNFVAAPLFALTFQRLVEAVSAITGWETSLWELLRVGERANLMARMFNLREGIGSDEDTVPDCFYKPMPGGPLKGVSIDQAKMKEAIQLYYEMVGWDSRGNPTRGKLVEFGLDWLVGGSDAS